MQNNYEAKPYIGSAFGKYLAGYYLLRNYDLDKSSLYFSASYKLSDNYRILQEYFLSLVISGQFEKALELIYENPNIESANLMLVLKDLKNSNYQSALYKIKNFNLAEDHGFIIPIIRLWCNINIENISDIESEFDFLNVNRGEYNLFKFQEILMLIYKKKNKEAEEELDQLFRDQQPIHYAELAENFYNIIKKEDKAENIRNKYGIQKNVQTDNLLDFSPFRAISILLNDSSIILQNNRFLFQSYIYSQLAYYVDDKSDINNFIIGNKYLSTRNYSKAIIYFKKINSGSKRYKLAVANIADCEYKLGNVKDAQLILQNLLNNFDSIEAALMLGEIYHNESKTSHAINLYDKVIKNISKKEQDLWLLYYMKAIYNQVSKNFIQAENDYLKAMELNPSNSVILNDIAYNWADSNRNLDQSLKFITKAISISPEDPQIIDTMGWVLYKLGRFEESLEYLDKAILLMPYDSTINEHIGDVYWSIGDKNNAKFEWQHAYNNCDEIERKNMIKEKIENGI